MVGNRRIRFIIVLDSCCISIGLVFIKDRLVSSFRVLRFRSRVLRFRDLGCFVFDLGCFVFEFWVLRASVFVFECFVFETTLGDGLSSFSKDNSANYLVKKKCSEAFRGVHNLRNVREKT